MKKVCGFITMFACLLSCQKDDVSLKDIASVESLPYLHVAYGTEFSSISLPATVTVKYSDNTTEDIPVTFSAGSYSGTVAGDYALVGSLTPAAGTSNTSGVTATLHVIVSPLKLKTVSQDGTLLYEYFYDTLDRLDHFHVQTNNTDYYYTYTSATDNTVTQRMRKYAGNDYPEKYYYSGAQLNKIEFYYGDNVLSETHTYTYTNGKISRYDNSNQSINGLKYRTFEYDADNNVTKVSFDFGNPWNYTYVADKKVATPLALDLADPQNQESKPVATFTYVTLSSYTSSYTYNAWGYPTQEVRTYPGDGNKTSTFTYTYQ